MKTIRFPMLVLCLLVLASCSFTNIREYPTEWAQMNNETQDEECPNLTGFYKQYGETLDKRNFTNSLSTYLLSPKLTNSSWLTNYNDIDITLVGNYIELQHSDKNKLQIKVRSIYEDYKNTSKDVTLSMRQDDFTCKDGTLVLKPRRYTLILVFSNILVKEVRSFKKNMDGWLVMELFETVAGNHTFIGVREKSNYWYRWEPVVL